MLDWDKVTPAQIMPHSGHMVLLDKIIFCDEMQLQAYAHIDEQHFLLPENAAGLPSYLGAEVMAQGVAAWAGAHWLVCGEPIRLGFLLGTRKLVFRQPEIKIGTQLLVLIKQSWQDDSGMGVFDCELRCCETDEILVSGAMNVYSPTNLSDLARILGKNNE